MKKFLKKINGRLSFIALVLWLLSCNKNNGYVEENVSYPDQAIYINQAAVATLGPNANGVYSITSNIENQPRRFEATTSTGKLTIPLGLTRSGVKTNGAYTVGIAANKDTITNLILGGKFALPDPTITTELLPADKFSLPSSVDIADGSSSASFNMTVDLSFLLTSATTTPKKRYAIAVTIANSAKASIVKTSLATAVIFIDPVQVILPVAAFSSYVYNETKTGNFINLSGNGVAYSWNFGDGTTPVSTTSPSHVYAASGTYTVTLTTTGIAGSGAPSVKSSSIIIP